MPAGYSFRPRLWAWALAALGCAAFVSLGNWQARRVFLMVPAQAIVARYVESFKEFPPRAKAASFTVSDVMERITTAAPSQN